MTRPLALTMPCGHGLFQSERAADGHNPVADLQIFRIAKVQGVEIRGLFDLEQGQIGLGVPSDNLTFILIAVTEFDFNLVGLFNHVIIGQDISVTADDKPRTNAPLFVTSWWVCPGKKVRKNHRRGPFPQREIPGNCVHSDQCSLLF